MVVVGAPDTVFHGCLVYGKPVVMAAAEQGSPVVGIAGLASAKVSYVDMDWKVDAWRRYAHNMDPQKVRLEVEEGDVDCDTVRRGMEMRRVFALLRSALAHQDGLQRSAPALQIYIGCSF